MPGISYKRSATGARVPVQDMQLAPCLASGGNTYAVIGSCYKGDFCVLSTNGTPGTGPNGINVPVFRPLLYADWATNSLSPGGILGIINEDFNTNSSGQYNGQPTYGLNPQSSVIFNLPTPSARFPGDTYSLHSRGVVIMATNANIFGARIAPYYTGGVMGTNLNGTLAGITLSTGLPAPLAPTVAQAAGTGYPAGTYYVVLTYTNILGETVASPATAVTTSSTNLQLSVTRPAGGVNSSPYYDIVVGYRVYVGTSATGPFYLQTNNSGLTTTLIATTPAVFGNTAYSTTTANPPVSNTSGNPGQTTYWIDPGVTTGPTCVRLLEVLGAGVDATFGTQFVSGNLTPGPAVEFNVLPQFAYIDSNATWSGGTIANLTPYTAN